MAGHKHAGGDELFCEKSKRQIIKAKFEKWRKGLEMEHQTLLWLQCDFDAKGTHVVSLYCAIHKKYETKLQSLKNYRRDWITGLTSQRTSNFINLPTSDVHKAMMPKLKVECSRARGESTLSCVNHGLGVFLSSMDDET